MELFGSYTSPFVRHCRIALLEGDIEHQFVEADYTASARQSPTQKVPFLHTDTLKLYDSSSILKYVREASGMAFLPDAQDFDRFCMVNTAIDALINLFLLEKEGVTPANNAYLKRQLARVETSFAEMNGWPLAHQAPYNDVELRLACFVDWVMFRQRLDMTPYPRLTALVEQLRSYEPFSATQPPQ